AVNVIDEAAARGFISLATGSVRVMPIHQRIVETETQAFGPRRIDILTNEIASRPLFGRAVVSELRVEVAEPFVMLARHHHVFHTGALGELRPRARGIRDWFEVWGELLVLTDRDAFVLHHPLVATERAVKSPVNEHAELRFMPPLHAPLAIFERRG